MENIAVLPYNRIGGRMISIGKLFRMHMDFDETEKYNWLVHTLDMLIYFENRTESNVQELIEAYLEGRGYCVCCTRIEMKFENKYTQKYFNRLREDHPSISDKHYIKFV